MGRGFGDPDDPLLLSVRSGAKFSMPGMMDTILNLGLNDDERRRPGRGHRPPVVRPRQPPSPDPDVRHDGGRGRRRGVRPRRRPRRGAGWPPRSSGFGRGVRAGRGRARSRRTRTASCARRSKRCSARGTPPRADAYRRREGIPHDLGTAVNVQVMVFGNRDDRSGTGVGFTRDPAIGAPPGCTATSWSTPRARTSSPASATPSPSTALGDHFPGLVGELQATFDRLEQHYRDMMDIEFTIEQDKLWILQTRVGKRTGAAAIRLAVAMSEDERIALTPAEAVARVEPDHIDQVLHPQLGDFDPDGPADHRPAAPARAPAVGRVYFTADDVVDRRARRGSGPCSSATRPHRRTSTAWRRPKGCSPPGAAWSATPPSWPGSGASPPSSGPRPLEVGDGVPARSAT